MSLVLPSSLERERKVNAVRSPLSPQERFSTDRAGYFRDHQRAAFATAEEQKKNAASEADGQTRTNKAKQLGRPLPSSEIIKRLLKLNPDLWFEVANNDSSKMGIYIRDESIIPERRQFICGFESGISPEFAAVITDASGETKGVIQGYRTVLAKLIKARLIKAHQVFALFGPPSRPSKDWHQMKVGA